MYAWVEIDHFARAWYMFSNPTNEQIGLLAWARKRVLENLFYRVAVELYCFSPLLCDGVPLCKMASQRPTRNAIIHGLLLPDFIPSNIALSMYYWAMGLFFMQAGSLRYFFRQNEMILIARSDGIAREVCSEDYFARIYLFHVRQQGVVMGQSRGVAGGIEVG